MTGKLVETGLGRFRSVVRDGVPMWLFECPGCGAWGQLDEDQWHGRVSLDHTALTGCGYHETHDYSSVLHDVLFADAEKGAGG